MRAILSAFVLLCSLPSLVLGCVPFGFWKTAIGASGGTEFGTSYSIGSPLTSTGGNNDLGMSITIAGSNITVTHLGRWVIGGNSQSHTLKIWGDIFGTPTVLGSVVVNCSGATSGQILYGALGTPITLTAGTTYAITSAEVTGQDSFSDESTVFHTSVATVNGLAYYAGSGIFGTAGSGCFGPLSFKY